MRFAGVVLPEGVHRTFQVSPAGFLSYEKEPLMLASGKVQADDLVSSGGFIVPGLVDAHCHVGLDANGAVPPAVQEEQAVADRDAGTLLIRDAGSAADTRWIDGRPDLPRIIRAGRHIARPKRYLRNYAEEVEPPSLVSAVASQARRGDGWVKLVGDWIDRSSGDLAPLWPRDELAAAIATAHSLGARVTAHIFSSEGIQDLLDAGIDCLEHGTGLTSDHISQMAAQGTALVPTRLQVENFPAYAGQGESKFPLYAKRIRSLYEGVDSMIRSAVEAGVPIYAGTDAGGVLEHGLIASEIQMLASASGLSPFDALGAGSWRARSWLGVPASLEEGAPADFVVYDTNPLDDLSVLSSPSMIVLRGHIVFPA